MLATPRARPLKEGSRQASEKPIQRIAIDTYLGMAFSNLIAYFIILTVAVTLHAQGKHDIDTAAQVAFGMFLTSG